MWFSVLHSHVTLRCSNGLVFGVNAKNKSIKKPSDTGSRVKKKNNNLRKYFEQTTSRNILVTAWKKHASVRHDSTGTSISTQTLMVPWARIPGRYTSNSLQSTSQLSKSLIRTISTDKASCSFVRYPGPDLTARNQHYLLNSVPRLLYSSIVRVSPKEQSKNKRKVFREKY